MRTTMKRGVGNADESGLNGDAPGNTGPRFGPLSPLSRYRVARGRTLRIAGKVILWLVIAAGMAVGGLAGGAWLFFADAIEAVRPTAPDVIEAKTDLVEIPDASAPTTALIIGFDERLGVDQDVVARSDTVMLLRADPNTDTMTLLSFPRDLRVSHPGCKARAPWVGKLNEAYTFCKASGTLRTVKELTGLEINYLITVNFRGFRQIVDKVGGVWIDIDQRYFNDRGGPGGYATINLEPGYQRLTGIQALDFARFRHTDNDIFRTLRQQVFVKSFKQQVEAEFSPLRLPGLVKAITENVQIQQGGRRDIDPNTVVRYARFIYELPSGAFHQVQLGSEAFSETRDGELLTSDETIAGALSEFRSPDAEAPTKAADVATGKKPKTPKPDNTTISVVNGNGEDGAAGDAAQRLRERGYQSESTGDADHFNYFDTLVRYRATDPDGKAAAEAVALLFDGKAEEAPRGIGFDTMLQVVVGATYHGSIAPGARDQTPDQQDVKVVSRTDDILPILQQAQKTVAIPILVPQVRQRDSILSPSDPVRTYKIRGKDALKIVFRWGAFKYWGVMQTAMTDAPILAGASTTRTINGRDYRLYFSGPRLTMVAFEDNDTAYWVTNTLDQLFSNETMLAIAQGLKPLRAS